MREEWSTLKKLIWLRARLGGGGTPGVLTTLSGTLPLAFTAVKNKIVSLIRYGKCEQASTPTPTSPVNIKCNNGTIMWSPNLFRTTATSKTQNGVRYEVLEDGRIRCTGTATGYSDLAVGRAYVTTDMGVIRIQLNGTYGGAGNIISSTVGLYDSDGSRLTTLTYNTWTQYVTVDLSEYPTVATVRVEIKRSSNKETDALIAVSITIGSSEVPWYQYGILITRGTKEVITLGEQTASVIDLYGIPANSTRHDAFEDSQNIITGEITRKCGVAVLDGTEEWTWDGSVHSLAIDNLIVRTGVRVVIMYCTHYPVISDGRTYANTPVDSMYVGSGGKISVKSSITNTADFKTFLTEQYAVGTPVIVVYPLQTQTTETVTGQNLSANIGSNTLDSASALSSVTGEVTYYA